MKKRVVSFIVCMIMSLNIMASSMATNAGITVIDCGNGYRLEISTYNESEINTYAIYSKSQTASAKAYHNGKYIGTFYLEGTFQYDTVRSKATDDSWYASSSYDYSGSSSHSGSKVIGKCTFDYAGGKTYSLTMTCDKNGNISYS